MGLRFSSMEKPIYEFVMECFGERDRPSYRQIAKGSGVKKRTLEKVARREVKDPGVHSVQKLADYFRKQKQKAA